MKTLLIDRQMIRDNAAVVKRRAEGTRIYAVLTEDAGGMGLMEVARLLREEGISRFAVTELSDAAALRREGFTDEEILMLRSTTRKEELERLIELNVVCTIGSYDTGVALNALAESRSQVAEAHVQVDTGMGFGGFLTEELDKILSVYRYLPNVAISGIYTQIHSTPRDADAKTQLASFQTVLDKLRQEGFEPGIVHAAGSAALFRYDFAKFDAVRVGSAFFGRTRGRIAASLQKVGCAQVTIDEVRWLPRGHTVGNEHPVRLRKPAKVAVLPIGTYNGLSVGRLGDGNCLTAISDWRQAKRLPVRIGGERVRVLGRPGALETVVDVTNVPCIAGDTAVLDIDPRHARGLTREYK
ncbi:MAG TPA: alanine racemase [Oscillospiraceae bacterium]|nr:alanine racemase [Oscillospiraceae bacterium]